jgi:hypothetical protein
MNVIGAIGFTVCGVHELKGRTLEGQLQQHEASMATNVSDVAAG